MCLPFFLRALVLTIAGILAGLSFIPSALAIDGRFAGGISGRYLVRSTGGFEKGYSDNGVGSPSVANPSIGARVFLQVDNGWRFGAGGTTLITDRQTNGPNDVRQTGAYGGLTAEKALYETPTFQLMVGGLLGAGSDQLKISTASTSSEINENYLALEPRISAEFLTASFMKVSFFSTYLWLISLGKNADGTAQRVDTLTANGLSLGVELLFGVF